MTNRRVLVRNIGDLVTLAPLAQQCRLTQITGDDLGRVKNAWLAVDAGKVVAFGDGPPPAGYRSWASVDAMQQLVLPGLVDAHTHPVFGGNRSSEFVQRLDGATYQSIAAAGGGIKYTVRQTRDASQDELVKMAGETFRRFLTMGVTTVEAKSGYGLSVEEELRLLRAIKLAADASQQRIVATCLALHAVMPEYESTEAFVKLMCDDLLPRVKQEGLAEYVDAFVENGYFSVAQTRPYIEAAQRLGLRVRIHADEFADAGAALAAAEWGADSADHVEHASDAAIKRMAQNGTVAILLPGTSLYTAIPFAKAARFRAQGCPVALATDFNPGSCQIDNLNFIATLGALHCGLRSAETVAAVTYVPAVSLGLGASKGSLALGFDADFCLYPMARVEDWLADLGRHLPLQVWVGGEQAFER